MIGSEISETTMFMPRKSKSLSRLSNKSILLLITIKQALQDILHAKVEN